MQVDKRAKPWLCAAKQVGGYGIPEPWLAGDELRATDGRMAVRIPVLREADDVDGPVTAEAMKSAAKCAVRSGTATIRCNGALEVQNGPTFPRPSKDDWRYPDVAAAEPDGEPAYTVTLDPYMLAKIAEAMGAKWVTLELRDEQAIRVLPVGGVPDAHGLMGPISA